MLILNHSVMIVPWYRGTVMLYGHQFLLVISDKDSLTFIVFFFSSHVGIPSSFSRGASRGGYTNTID